MLRRSNREKWTVGIEIRRSLEKLEVWSERKKGRSIGFRTHLTLETNPSSLPICQKKGSTKERRKEKGTKKRKKERKKDVNKERKKEKKIERKKKRKRNERKKERKEKGTKKRKKDVKKVCEFNRKFKSGPNVENTL